MRGSARSTQPPTERRTASQNRAISRAHTVLDHGERDGVDNFVSIVGGKLTTYRLMAEQTADVVCAKLGVTEPCTTADEILPDQGPARRTTGSGDRLAEHEADGGGDAALICECEFVTRPMLERFPRRALAVQHRRHPPGDPAGHGSLPGRVLHVPGRRADGRAGCRRSESRGRRERRLRYGGRRRDRSVGRFPASPDAADDAIVGYLRERFNGTRPIAAGRQLQELWMAARNLRRRRSASSR